LRQDARVRVVVSFVGGWGHAEPLLPVASLAAELGHDVSFAGQAAVLPRLTALGHDVHAVGPDTLASDRQPLVPVDRDAERAVMRDHFVGRYGRHRATVLGDLLRRERADLVVCDEVDVGAVVAAETHGIPCATVNVIAAGLLTAPAVIGSAWQELRAEHGLAPDPDGRRIGGDLALAPLPRSFRSPAAPASDSMRFVRPPILDEVVRAERASRPLVYATLGTVFNVESGDLLERLVHGLNLIDAEVVLTTGPHVPVESLPAPRPHLRIEAFVPQREVLGRCRAVVCHAGSGTLVAALSLGIAVVVLPMGADQPDNADRCAELGVGPVLDPLTATPDEIAEATEALLGDATCAEAAASLATEAAAQPPASQLPALLYLLGA
jgi:UDP:flavonoid glycosyltransferase YjiC (YdhE family)